MHDLLGALFESIASAFSGDIWPSRGWLYVIGYFALLATIAAFVLLFTTHQ